MQALPSVQELLGSHKFATTLEQDSAVEGRLVCKGPASISGHVTGSILAKSLLVIEKDAIVDADVTGEHIIIHGKVNGTLTANVGVQLTGSAEFSGEIHAPVIEMEKGARFDGQSHMSEMIREADPAQDREVPSAVHKLQHDLEAFVG